MMATQGYAPRNIALMSFEKAVLRVAVAAVVDDADHKRAILNILESSGMADTDVTFSREQIQFVAEELRNAIRSTAIAGTHYDTELARSIADGLAARFNDLLRP